MNTFDDDVIQLIGNMVVVFQQKKEAKKISERIRRGRSSASAGEFEDELAKLIEQHTPKDVDLLVDFPLSYRLSARRTKTIYPDIAIIRSNSLIGVIEAKIDLGYLAEGWARSRKQTLTELALVGKVTAADGKELVIPKQLATASIVLTARNHTERLRNFRKETSCAVVLLSRDHRHPNRVIGEAERHSYIAEVETDTNREEWRRLERFLQGVVDSGLK